MYHISCFSLLRFLSSPLLLFPLQRHFTATAFVIDSQRRVLLLWHKRLNRWMPPGGHIDPDEMPEETAQRECKEETGLDVEIIGESQKDLFQENHHEGQMLKKPIALLLENIPESKERGEPAHQHMDFLYLARPVDESQVLMLEKKEGAELRWFTRDQILNLDTKTEIFANVQAYILHILASGSSIQ